MEEGVEEGEFVVVSRSRSFLMIRLNTSALMFFFCEYD